jgi:glucan phosphoethanolaminetransferase (alkaline phosphatase superfamily)
MSYEYLMQAVLLIFLLIVSFPVIVLWSKWKKKKRR